MNATGASSQSEERRVTRQHDECENYEVKHLLLTFLPRADSPHKLPPLAMVSPPAGLRNQSLLLNPAGFTYMRSKLL